MEQKKDASKVLYFSSGFTVLYCTDDGRWDLKGRMDTSFGLRSSCCLVIFVLLFCFAMRVEIQHILDVNPAYGIVMDIDTDGILRVVLDGMGQGEGR